jgi:hypothetical protein
MEVLLLNTYVKARELQKSYRIDYMSLAIADLRYGVQVPSASRERRGTAMT